MSLPKKVQQELDNADRLQQGLATPATPTPQGEPEVEHEEPPQPSEPAPTPPPVEDDAAKWKHKYDSFKGLADAELARMRQQVADANGRTAQLEAQVADLTKKVEAKPDPAPQAEAPPEVTKGDVQAFGEDLIDLQERIAKRVLYDARKVWTVERDALMRRIDELQSGVNTVSESVGKTGKDLFFDRLNAAIPGWEQTNEDPAFLQWLAQPEPLLGVTRQEILNTAAGQLDAQRVIAVFSAFRQVSTPTPPVDDSRKVAAESRRNTDLERQVSPGKTRSSAAPAATPDTRIWTQAEISKFYDDVIHGRLTADAAARTETEINQAVATGRVR